VILVAEGSAVAHSPVLAAPLLALLLVAVAVEVPLVPFLGVVLLVRVLSDATLSSPSIRHTGSLNLSGAIALLFVLVAAGLVIRRRRGARQTALAAIWLGLWTAVAVGTHGASAETVREGVREISIVSLGVIAYNSNRVLNVTVATRLIQVVGALSAIVALGQLATHGGLLINGQMRPDGTFTHPNSASMFFAIAATISLWRFVELGRRRSDAALSALFCAATVSTFSLGGLAGLLAMLVAFGALQPGSFSLKMGGFVAAALVVVVFVATPLGSERISQEASTSITSASSRGTANTSLAWRLYKWGTLIPEWEKSPILGQGLGSTVAVEGTSENEAVGKVPHNEYVRYLVETGLAGVLTLLWGLGTLLGALARRRGNGFYGAGTLGLAIVIGCLINALASNTFLYTTTGYATALILGAVLAVPVARGRFAPNSRKA